MKKSKLGTFFRMHQLLEKSFLHVSSIDFMGLENVHFYRGLNVF